MLECEEESEEGELESSGSGSGDAITGDIWEDEDEAATAAPGLLAFACA